MRQKKSHLKIVSKLLAKISYYELVSQAQVNDEDLEASNNTNNIIVGLKESIKIIDALKQKDINKSILKEAEKFLCLDELTVLDSVNLIIADFNYSGDKMIDWVEGIQIIELFESTFTICVFLNLIGIKCAVNEQIEFLK